MTDENQVQTTHAYDLFGRVLRSETQGTAPVTTTYPDPWTVVTTQGGRTTTEKRDGFGRLQYEYQPDGSQLYHGYDQHSRLRSIEKTGRHFPGAHATQYTLYDILDRPIARKDFDGTEVRLAYAAGGNGCNQVTRIREGLLPAITLTDPFGQVVESTAPTEDVTRNAYDGRGSLISATLISAADGSRQVRTFQCDGLGRTRSKTEPETGTQVRPLPQVQR